MELLFEITGQDVAKLNDTDLRTLVGLLCEAEFRNAGLPLSSITWGGDQNAADGGLDVLVNYSGPKFSIDFVPMNQTGYQVKKPNLQPSKIGKEMRPKGVLRESIKNLMQLNGAYIIASSCSTSATSLAKRVQAMRHALSDQLNGQNLYLDFYDCSRLASWARKHPSIILWLRNKVGRQLKGWQPFGNWSCNVNLSEEYILDETLRLRNATETEDKGLNSTSALREFRSLLSVRGASVRLVGLSGVGKTRFVQALFERIGENSLNPNLAIYTDMSDGPSPDPNALAEELISQRANCILIVDNCPPELHSRLTKTCKAPDSKINLLTIEYDVRDDIPDETDAFILEPSSDDLIEKLIQRRYPKFGQVNAKTIAEAAGGNARVALALARTVKSGESISSLRDEELFTRLFKQRYSENDDLLISAEVCSLVYSFDGTATDENSELNLLAGIIGIQPKKLYRDVTTLKQRNLVQSRSKWRAVLPHAIANKLAKRALESVQIDVIANSFEGFGGRLLKSFSRRLSYLHDCVQAIEITSRWLKPNGLLGMTKGNLSEFGLSILRNITPVSPSNTLDFLSYAAESDEKFASRENPNFYKFIHLLSSIAYDPDLFYKSTKLICRFALTERAEENNNSIRNELGRLFQMHLSGTHASVNQRSSIVTELLESALSPEQQLGLFLLGRSLSTGTFTGSAYSFGARPRDYGWTPRTQQEIFEWYKIYVEICVLYSNKPGDLNVAARKLLADNFRGLWRVVKLRDILCDASRKLQGYRSWNDGWVAVKSIFQYDGERYNEEDLVMLKVLEEFLRPNKLIDRARTIALTARHDIFDFDKEISRGEIGNGWEKMRERAEEIGGLVAMDQTVLNELLPELLSTHNERIYSFGRGFGDGCDNQLSIWQRICEETANISPDKRQYNFALGFLISFSNRDHERFQAVMDDLVEHTIFAPIFPYFQTYLGFDLDAIKRIRRSLELGVVSIRNYQSIAYAHVDESVSEEPYIELLEVLLSRSDGILIVIECIYFRLNRELNTHIVKTFSNALLSFSRKVLSSYNFSGNVWENNDHQLSFLIKELFKEYTIEFDEVCRHIKESSVKHYNVRYDYREVIQSLASSQPFKFLDIIVGESKSMEEIDDINSNDGNISPFDKISDEVIISWCETNRNHVPTILTLMTPSNIGAESKIPEWRPAVLKLLEMAINLDEALKALRIAVASFHWRDGSGALLADRLTLLKTMENNSQEEIRKWARATATELEERAKSFYEYEGQRHRAKNEAFE